MAGFLDTKNIKTGGALSNLSKFGTRHEDLLLRNSQAIGFIEGQLASRSSTLSAADDLLKFSMAISDTTSQLRTKAVAFFQLDYAVKRERLRDVASNGEIDETELKNQLKTILVKSWSVHSGDAIEKVKKDLK